MGDDIGFVRKPGLSASRGDPRLSAAGVAVSGLPWFHASSRGRAEIRLLPEFCYMIGQNGRATPTFYTDLTLDTGNFG